MPIFRFIIRKVFAGRFKRYTSGIKRNAAGFTLTEIIIVLGIFAVLMGLSFGAMGTFRDDSDLVGDADSIQSVLRLAQNKTVSSESDKRYGVYFNSSTSPHEYVLFQTDTDYASRVSAQDVIYTLSDVIQFSSVTFSGLSGAEIVFDRLQGTTGNAGNVVLESIKNSGKTTTIYVTGAGSIGNGGTSVGDEGNCTTGSPAGDRICDSRHVHIDYTRNPSIDTINENIILNFDAGAHIETIVIADNMSGGQIVWEGTVNVAGEEQTIKVLTHQLNNGFDSQFSVHRDARYNSKPLTIELDGGTPEDTGTLIEYDTLGVVTLGTSIYVTATQEQ